jgi:hypothetical protein
MISITCSHCGSKLNAKDELAGQTRPCPKCRKPILIAATPLAGTTPDRIVAGDGRPGQPASSGTAAATLSPPASGLPSHHYLDRLNRQHVYYVCDRTRVIGAWENNGHGWLLRSHTGMVSAARNQQLLPQQGNFRLVEVKATPTDEGTRLIGLTCYQLADRWALNALARGDDEIVEKIVGHAGLSREQKNAVRGTLKERFMHDVWQHARAIAEFLASADYHAYEA